MILASAFLTIVNCSDVQAYTYVSTKTSGNYSEALYYEDTTARIDSMSSWIEFTSAGGTLTYSDASSKETKFSAAVKLGSIWTLNQVKANLGVTYSSSRTIGTGASWNIVKKCRARIVTRWYRRKTRIYRYNIDNTLLNTFDSIPARTTSAIGIEQQNI